ncbi:MAG: TAXI family TRAP transporter solute-binding subunit [Tistlia sp.]|uniref:TAXI family TRAP transporter solute-binding subunit n=1 Tax=Tistlia sp. TaxID=3057121 RepID=UPI0034A147DB
MACTLAALAVGAVGCAQVTRRPDVVIGTASPTEIDYPLGGSICRLFNLARDRHGLRCAERPSEGAVANLEALRDGRIEVGIATSDLLADAVAGRGPFALAGPAGELRVLFAGHADVFTLVVHQESTIRSLDDLRGKRISIGNPGSRQRADMENVLAALGLTRADFAEVRELAPAEQNRAFCAEEVDAIVYSVAQPNGLIADATQTCRGRLVPVSGPAIDRMLSEKEDYERAVIAGGTYSPNPADVESFGVRAVVVTTTRMSEAVAYEIARAVFDDFDDFRRLHPAFEALSVANAVHRTGAAPVHPGAALYYRQQGWAP